MKEKAFSNRRVKKMITKENLRSLDIAASLSEDAFDQVFRQIQNCGIERIAKAGEIIAYPGHPTKYIYFVISGSIRSNSYTPNGKKPPASSFFSDSLNMIFFVNCFTGTPIRSYYYAAEDSHLLLVHIDDLTAIMDAVPELRRTLLQSFCNSVQDRLEHLYTLSYKKSRQRICAFLLTQCTRDFVFSGEHLVLIPFNQEEWAEYLNMTRPVLSKELHTLQDSGANTIQGRKKIYVPSIELLADIVSKE